MNQSTPKDGAPDFTESPEFKAYMDELFERLPRYAEMAAHIPPGEYESIEWFGEIGKFWREAREQTGLSRNTVAEKMGLASPNAILFLEIGLAKNTELTDEFLTQYAQALGNPSLVRACKNKFNIS